MFCLKCELFYVQVTVHHDNLRINNQQDASSIQNFILSRKSQFRDQIKFWILDTSCWFFIWILNCFVYTLVMINWMTSVLLVSLSLLNLNFNRLLILMLMMLLALVASEVGLHNWHFGERTVSVRFAIDVQLVCSSNTSVIQLTVVWFQ